jgi:hypothetical protein
MNEEKEMGPSFCGKMVDFTGKVGTAAIASTLAAFVKSALGL